MSGRIAWFVAVLGVLVLLSGCTAQERRGISPLPQNRPADWEYQPYVM